MKRQKATAKKEPKVKKTKKNPIKALGIFSEKKKLFCFFSSPKTGCVVLAESEDAENFSLTKGTLPVEDCDRVHVSRLDIGHVAAIELAGKGLQLVVSRDLIKWKSLAILEGGSNGVIVPEYQKDGEYLMLRGGKSIELACSRDGKRWKSSYPFPLDLPKRENETFELDMAEKLSSGILICYRLMRHEKKTQRHQVHLALLDSNSPTHILWRSPSPIWEDDVDWKNAHSAGATFFLSQLFGLWSTGGETAMLVRYPVFGLPFSIPRDRSISLEKAWTNPIVHPRPEYSWESFTTFNPAAFYADGKVHILYRAQGHDLVSSIGYANSRDGLHVDERLSAPIYHAQEVFESRPPGPLSAAASHYTSGGGIAGCEDPRVTVIEKKLYMTYVAFDGANPPRVALTSIQLEDFLNKRWLWERPVLISPPGIVDKSAVIFPEKIHGKYAIMHRIFPDILIDFESDLDFDGTRWLKGQYRIPIRRNMWDSRKIGAGAPPIKTSEGWLLIYYGVDAREAQYYKMGAMLLDLENPTRVLYRSSTPILEPEEWYESSGFKPGIVYPCGAVTVGEKLLIYYGGADSVVCVASADLSQFLRQLKSNSRIHLENATTRSIRLS